MRTDASLGALASIRQNDPTEFATYSRLPKKTSSCHSSTGWRECRLAIWNRASLQSGADEDQAIAALLHIAVEDTSSSSLPSARMLFFSRPFSSVRSATHFYREPVSQRRSLTSSVGAAGAVSPARRRLPFGSRHAPGMVALPHSMNSTKCNTGSGRCLPCSTARRRCRRYAGLRTRS